MTTTAINVEQKTPVLKSARTKRFIGNWLLISAEVNRYGGSQTHEGGCREGNPYACRVLDRSELHYAYRTADAQFASRIGNEEDSAAARKRETESQELNEHERVTADILPHYNFARPI